MLFILLIMTFVSLWIFRRWNSPSELCFASSKHSSSFLELKSKGNSLQSQQNSILFDYSIFFVVLGFFTVWLLRSKVMKQLKKTKKIMPLDDAGLLVDIRNLPNNTDANFPLVQRDTEAFLWKHFKVDRIMLVKEAEMLQRAVAADSLCLFNSV